MREPKILLISGDGTLIESVEYMARDVRHLAVSTVRELNDAYTFAELQGMFAEAGLGTTTRHEVVPGNPQTILVSQ